MHKKQHYHFEKKGRLPYQVLVFPYLKEKGSYLYAIFKRRDLKFWQGISGGGEGNEIPLQAVKREVFEEAKIDSEFMQLDSMTTIPVENIGDYRWEGVFVVPEYAFGVKAKSRDLKISGEHLEYKWLSFKEAHKLLKYDSNKTALWELNQRLSSKN
ncbi:NUDIX pyrophosphatase [Candidatus Parcubacteria bacterium]|nr:NUDIX pyrophosphatase [Patescibacteria group bacterium]MBU4467022.1 NUDIX pyrophosphatase [Patescibacteria group bacterium]MCG2688679.1 NUDIX pyrophosphatase [Candidatus Parcubacteria bacterium]